MEKQEILNYLQEIENILIKLQLSTLKDISFEENDNQLTKEHGNVLYVDFGKNNKDFKEKNG